MCLLRSRVRLPSSAERRIGRERLGRKRRWRNLRISLTSGKRESPGVKRSQRCDSRTA